MLKRAAATLLLGVVGALVAAIGAGSHRSTGYVGIVLALALVACAAIFAKAWQSWFGFVAFATFWVGATVFFAGKGPGESVLVAGDFKGHAWVYGGAAGLAVVGALPRFVLVGRNVAS